VLSGTRNKLKFSRAHSRVKWLQEETDVLGTTSVPNIRVLMWLDTPSTRLCAREDFVELVAAKASNYIRNKLMNGMRTHSNSFGTRKPLKIKTKH
jgi:hypothetical protein